MGRPLKHFFFPGGSSDIMKPQDRVKAALETRGPQSSRLQEPSEPSPEAQVRMELDGIGLRRPRLAIRRAACPLRW